MSDLSKRGEASFKPASPIKPFFASYKNQFGPVDVPNKKEKLIKYNIQEHDSSFRPVASGFNNGEFSYP